MIAESPMLTMEQACTQACAAIAPAWPLDRSIAVNPHWGRIDRPVGEVAARMALLASIRVLAPRAMVREAWAQGRVTREHLDQALAALGRTLPEGSATPSAEDCLAVLNEAPESPTITPLPLLIDVLDDDPQRHTRLSWRDAITHQVSQTCAAYFDRAQAQWQPAREQGLYAFWRETLVHDHGIGVLMGLPDLGHALGHLPADRAGAERWALERLDLPGHAWADYLEAVLLTVQGWASWCAYLGWDARLQGREDYSLRELLAIRLAWGAVLLECKAGAATAQAFAALRAAWADAPAAIAQARAALLVDEAWQLALECAFQHNLCHQLIGAQGKPRAHPQGKALSAQAVFCIDVRSEPLRRALEAVWPQMQTLGFAGFFGLPLDYAPLGTQASRPQLPGLLSPSLHARDDILAIGDAHGGPGSPAPTQKAAHSRQQRLAVADVLHDYTRRPSSAFSFVEAAGLGYLPRIGPWLRPSAAPRARADLDGLAPRYRDVCRPALTGLAREERVALAARVLRSMQLDAGMAPLVMFIAHGSQSTNNAHASGLDCGACCGQTGEVNARVLARLLNEPSVRAGLQDEGIDVPADTVFVAGLHNTTTEELEWFDTDLLPPQSRAAWEQAVNAYARAGARVRREKAPALGYIEPMAAPRLLDALRRRANDGAQTRPEWGLAGNAAFVIAPRGRTRGLDLGGRVFLHEYESAHDPGHGTLELLMTAPMVVAHWINWQYNASTCDPQRLGSGNKLLHNVVGGHIGVFEGNGGDLRIGLSRQSLHDGRRWMHEPLRLTVVIDAPQGAIDGIIEGHAIVRQLVKHQWLHLWRFAGDGLERRDPGGWNSLD